MKPIVKIVIFIGLLLLIIAVCAYTYLNYKEGFQNTALGGSGSLCPLNDVNADVCPGQCQTAYNPDPNALPPESSDEQQEYDIYEYYNLNELNIYLPPQTTPLSAYNMGSQLSSFDTGAPIPWDYDNVMLDPQQVLWGTVATPASHGIFNVAYTTKVFGSPNSSDYIASDPENNRSLILLAMFNIETPSYLSAQTVGFLNNVTTLVPMIMTQHILQPIIGLPGKASIQHGNAVRLLRRGNPSLSYDDASKAIEGAMARKTAIVSDEFRRQDRANFFDKHGKGDKYFKNGVLNQKGIDRLASREKAYVSHAFKSGYPTKKSLGPKVWNALNPKVVNPEKLGAVAANSMKSAMLVGEKGVAAERKIGGRLMGFIKKLGKGKLSFKKIMKPLSALLNRLSPSKVYSLMKAQALKFGRRIAQMFVKLIPQTVALEVTADTMLAVSAALTAKGEAEEIAGDTLLATPLAPAGAALATEGAADIAAGAALNSQAIIYRVAVFLLEFMEISCFTWVPMIMGSVYDPSNSVCPKDHGFNIEQAVIGLNPGGEVLWAILSGIPVLGALLSAFGPYLCWNSDISNPVVLIETIHPPAYYSDPTLSLFTVEKTYTKTFSGTIVSGVTVDDPSYYDPALYKDMNDIYPIWVDYSNRVMLDKMAQFYYDNSRKYMTVNADGTAKFEYISKFYGIISSSEFSCDIQCEITEITVNTLTGIKLCERIVPPVADGPCTWHDRRFYFYIDITKGVNLETPANKACGDCLTKLQDNTDMYGNPIKFSSRDPCYALLGNIATMYDQYGQPINDTLNQAQQKCGLATLMYNAATPTTNAASVINAVANKSNRANWEPHFRMQDNMAKFFVTGCTCIDGTAPAAADVSNQLSAGTPIGTSIVALGMPGATVITGETSSGSPAVDRANNTIAGSAIYVPENSRYNIDNFSYNPPTVGGITTEITSMMTRIPDDNTCEGVKRAFVTYGTTVGKKADQMIANAQSGNALTGPSDSEVVLVASDTPESWIFSYTDNTSNHNQIKSAAFYDSSGNVQTAKYLNLTWSGCVQDPGVNFNGATCLIKNNWVDILYGTLVARVGMGKFPLPGLKKSWTVKQINTLKQGIGLGSIFVTSAIGSYTGIDSYLTCLTEDASKQSGTFIINGNVVTSKTTQEHVNFMAFQGPIMPFSPGYTPTIDFKTNTPDITLVSCVNRYTVRYFVSTFRSQYPQYILKKIINITPRPIVKNNVNARLNNSTPCCAFYVEYTSGQTGVPQYDMFGLTMTLNGFANAKGSTNNVYLHQPTKSIIQPVPQAVPFTVASKQDIIPKPVVGTPSYQLLPPNSSCKVIDCSNQKLQKRLFEQFNQKHMGVNIDLDTNADGSYDSVIQAYTPDFVLDSGIQKCIYNLKLNKFTASPNPDIFNELFNLDPKIPVVTNTPGGQTTLEGTTAPQSGSTYSYSTGGKQPYVISDLPMLGTNEEITAVVTMTLQTVENPTNNDELCLYDLYVDNYPDNIWYTHVPVNHFDVPPTPTPINNNFSKQTQYTPCVIDCSNTALMQNLVTQFNKNNTAAKINLITRSYTPLVAGSNAVCDYDVEMVRNSGPRTLVNEETVRFYLKPTSPASCMFDLDHDDSVNPNSGLSLNSSTTLGMFISPFTWSSSFIRTINKKMDEILININALNGINIINSISKNALTTVNSILNAASLTQTLQACPKYPCNHPYILQKILNRFNFNNYPKYPEGQYYTERLSIAQFRKSGISSPTQCHVELVEQVTKYGDILYEPKKGPSDDFGVSDYLQKWAFDLIGSRTDGCNFTVKDLSGTDISTNVMNINVNAFSPLQPVKDSTGQYNANNIIVSPDLLSQSVDNPALKIVDSKLKFSYTEPKVDCLDPAVLKAVKTKYDAINVARAEDRALTSTVKRNTLYTALKSFNPVPNVCEYVAQAVHTYYDDDYGWYYTVPDTSQKKWTFDANDTTYLVAQWAANTDYEVETGKLLINSPSVTEYHMADLQIIKGEFYREDGTGPLNLPYIAGIGYTPAGIDTSNPRFSSVMKSFVV